jgi:hypothetical protein
MYSLRLQRTCNECKANLENIQGGFFSKCLHVKPVWDYMQLSESVTLFLLNIVGHFRSHRVMSLSDKRRPNKAENTFQMTEFTLQIYHKSSIDVYIRKKLKIFRENDKIKKASCNLALLLICLKF